MKFMILMTVVGAAIAAQNCAWFVGRLQCSDRSKLADAVVEIWDHDRSIFPISMFVDDDLAGRTIVSDEENGTFRVEGCASDMDILFFKNDPEFYLKIRHYCKGKPEVTIAKPKNQKIFVPETNDYFNTHPIRLG